MNNNAKLLMAIMLLFTIAYIVASLMSGVWILLIPALIAFWVFLLVFKVYLERKNQLLHKDQAKVYMNKLFMIQK